MSLVISHGVTDSCVYHKTQNILDTIKGQESAINALPHAFVVGAARLDHSSELVDVFGIPNRDFEVGALLVTLEAEKVFTKHHLHGVYSWLVLRQLSVEEGLEAITVRL